MSVIYGAHVARRASTIASCVFVRGVTANDCVARRVIASGSVARELYATGANL